MNSVKLSLNNVSDNQTLQQLREAYIIKFSPVETPEVLISFGLD